MNSSYYTGLHVLSEIIYQKPGIASFPIFKDLPLQAGFSWGKDAANMTLKIKENKEIVTKRHNDFFHSLQIPDFSSSILIDPNITHDSQIEEVTHANLKKETLTITGANILFTKDPTVSLITHPGDCPCVVLFARNNDNQPLLGLFHFRRRQTDDQLPKKAIMYLETLQIKPETAIVGITPGIAQKNYTIPVATQEKELPYAEKWGKYITTGEKDGKEVYFLDVTGYIVQQLISCGVLPDHIEVYDIDTYATAEKGESFSHRYATVTQQPDKDGRFLFAASLS